MSMGVKLYTYLQVSLQIVIVPVLGHAIECWRRKWQPTPALLPGKSHGRRSLIGYSPWDNKELDTTERLKKTTTTTIETAQMPLFI